MNAPLPTQSATRLETTDAFLGGNGPPDSLWGCSGVGCIIPSCIAVVSIVCVGLVTGLDSASGFHRTEVSPDSPVGWVGILGCTLLYGSYGILVKAPSVKALNAGQKVLQVYINLGVAATFLVVAALKLPPQDFKQLSWWGLCAGFVWPMLNMLANVGICSLGYGVACTLWAGVTIAVAFTWGHVVLGQAIKSLLGSVAGLLVLFLGILGAVASRYLATGTSRSEDAEGQVRAVAAAGKNVSKARGCICMTLGAVMNGSLQVPYVMFARSDAGLTTSAPELAYLLSFVLGMATSTACIVGALHVMGKPLHFRTLAVPGFLTGFYWSSGYICALFATKYLGNNVGYPLCQTGIVVGGLWGILYYGEIAGGLAISTFAASVVLILAGAAMLANWAVV